MFTGEGDAENMDLVINMVSTGLITASSYTMQRLSAPTRFEVDPAHRKKGFLSIGIVSTTNVSRTNKRKAALRCLLCLSTLPLRLL